MPDPTPSIFNQNLDPNIANHQPLTPLTFLEWSATVYPDKTLRLYTAIPSTPTGSSPGAADSSPPPSQSGA